jgi:hypothetical protein
MPNRVHHVFTNPESDDRVFICEYLGAKVGFVSFLVSFGQPKLTQREGFVTVKVAFLVGKKLLEIHSVSVLELLSSG